MRQPTPSATAPRRRPGASPLRPRHRALRDAGLALGLLATAATGLTACGNDDSGSSGSASSATVPGTSAATVTTTTGTPTPTATTGSPTGTGTTAPPPPATTKPASCVDRAVSGMSRSQQVGQLFMTAVSSTGMTSAQSAAITNGHVGSVFLMGHTSSGTAAVKHVTDSVRRLAPSVKGAKVGMLVSTDQEGGRVQVLNGPGFSRIPSAVEQGRLPASTLQQDARTWGGQLKSAGVTMNLAPVADTVPPDLVNVNAPIGKLQREYGTNPSTVATHSTAFMRGMLQAGLLASPKHFPGLGRVTGNTDFTAGVTDDTTTRNDAYLQPFRGAIDAGAPFVMVSSAIYSRIDPNHQAAFSSTVMRGVLRNDLGFKGAIISDDLGAAVAVSDHTPAERAVDFLKAGGNLLLTVRPSDIAPMTSAVLDQMGHDSTLTNAVTDSVRRVLTAKQKVGLLSCG